MALHNYDDQGSDVRTAQLLAPYDQEMDEPGDEYVSDVLRFAELDERTDGAHIFRLMFDRMGGQLPLLIEVFEVEGSDVIPVHRVRAQARNWRERFAHPWAF